MDALNDAIDKSRAKALRADLPGTVEVTEPSNADLHSCPETVQEYIRALENLLRTESKT